MNSKISISSSSFLKTFILLSPICDLLTGICIFKLGMPETFIGSPSQLLRLIFLAVSFYYIPFNNKNTVIKIFLALITLEATCLFYVNSVKPFVTGINYSLKILYIVLLYYLIKQVSNKSNGIPIIINAFLNASLLYALGIIIPTLLGIGVNSYAEGTFGQKGLFASGNALNIYMGIASSISILKKNKTLIEYIRTFLLLLSLLLLATKTAFLFLFTTILLYIFKQKISIKIVLLFFIPFVIISNWESIENTFLFVFDVVSYRFENRESLLSFILSGRNQYIIDAFSEFFKSPIWGLKFIIGGGAYISFRSTYHTGMPLDLLEMDFFDVFFMYGIIGLSIYIYISYSFLKSCSKNKIIFFLLLLFIFHSALAGHVLFDGIPMSAGIILILMNKNAYYIKSQFWI